MSRPEREEAMTNWVQGAFGSVLEMKTLAMEQSDWHEGRGCEVALCDAGLGGQVVLDAIRRAGDFGIDLRVVPVGQWAALGGHRRESAPDALLSWGADGLGRLERRRTKRRVDVAWSLLILLLGPGRGAAGRQMTRRTARDVLSGRMTWIGFHGGWEGAERLPELSGPVFSVGTGQRMSDPEEAKRLDLRYAFDFGWMREVELLMTLRMD